MKKYLRIMRLDHWIKQFFIIPGCVAALYLTDFSVDKALVIRLIAGFIATCLIASANYTINEWLDAEFDKFHPVKKYRTVVSESVSGKIIWLLWVLLTIAGLGIAFFVNIFFFFMCLWLWVMGIIYNVKPLRTKDIPYLDVLSESVNNAIRLLMGWFIVTVNVAPPSSFVLGYWMAGAYLMAIKRFAEYRMIGDKNTAGSYRKSFKYYTEQSLLISSFFYAMSSVFFLGIFMIKYRMELILLIPVMIGLYCYYFSLSFNEDSSVQKPEKLFEEKGLMIYCFVMVLLFILLMNVNIDVLYWFTDSELISIK